ncbi:MAG: serine hydroxymethyltransferase [Armatimonadetes bacterium]|nr:serine hydroxymethyltransferase [Armatimonadota bacterium]
MSRTLAQADAEVAEIIQNELERQQNTLMLIPSENYASRAVMAAAGSVMTNKYAEGYPGRRYYNGCMYYDEIENLARDRAKALFRADHANVQPTTGTSANMAAYYALLKPGDRILAMKIEHGGHLSHGMKINFSGQQYEAHFYGLSEETDQLDYDEIRDIAREVKPKLIVAGASAYPRVIDFRQFAEIADEVGAYCMADIAHIVGLVAAGAHPDPVPICDVVTSTTHKTLRGPRGAIILCKQEHAKKIDRAVFPGVQAGPLMHIIAAKAVAFKEAQSLFFREYQRQIVRNAHALATSLQEEGFRLVTGGTDNHLMLVDLRNMDITGKEAANLMEEAGMVVNKNLIPGDERSPDETSGIRPGTPGMTTRGMQEPEMQLVGKLIARVIKEGRNNDKVLAEVRKQVLELCEAFPIYEHL